MESNEQNNQTLTKRERKELKRQERIDENRGRQLKRVAKKWTKRLAIGIAIIGFIGGIFWYVASRPVVSAEEILTVVADDWVKGNTNASVVLIEYLDFECEACGAYYPVTKRLAEEFGDKVKFVNRYFPLPGHKNSMTSALAAEAAGRQGKYWEMHNILFENQKEWGEKQSANPKIFEDYARQIGLDMDRYSKDIKLPELKERITRDRSAGQKLNIASTPTFFLNGEKINNPRGYQDFKALLQAAVFEADR